MSAFDSFLSGAGALLQQGGRDYLNQRFRSASPAVPSPAVTQPAVQGAVPQTVQPQQSASSHTLLYVGLGVAALVVLVLVARAK